MLRSRTISFTARCQPLTSHLKAHNLAASKRYSSSSTPKQDDKARNKSSDRAINFRNFISVGIISSIILTQVVDAVNKEKPLPRSMSESEYYRQQQRLKRKVSLFNPQDKEVYFLKSDKPVESLTGLEGFDVIDPAKLVSQEKTDESSKYHALLNDPDTVELPRGLVIYLIGKYMKTKPNGKFLILNFPADVKESAQFEDKIVTIKKLISLNDSEEVSDVVKYYKTVDKVENITSIKELAEVLE